jgi:hypothetical protein
LSLESNLLYDMLKANTQEEYEVCFLQYKESLDAVKTFVDETQAQFRAMDTDACKIHA